MLVKFVVLHANISCILGFDFLVYLILNVAQENILYPFCIFEFSKLIKFVTFGITFVHSNTIKVNISLWGQMGPN